MNKYNKLFNMQGKVVFVAGGAGAIGSEIARAMTEYGAHIAIADINEEAVHDTTASLAEMGTNVIGLNINVMEEKSVISAVENDC
jgi:NAD(P)-dependent dehydrogenase (short-subunit alcohol dehydrogenase family)